MTDLPTQYLQVPPHLSQASSNGNEGFMRSQPLQPYRLTHHPMVPETEGWFPSPFETWDYPVHTMLHEAEGDVITLYTASSYDPRFETLFESFIHSRPVKHHYFTEIPEDRVLAHGYQFGRAEAENVETAIHNGNEKRALSAYGR